jgi:hypothetical protein
MEKDRNVMMLELRPEVVFDREKASKEIEDFQTRVLRPILKFQNELLMGYYKNYISGIKVPDTENEKILFVGNMIQKDAVLKNRFLGMVVGLFTKDDLDFYLNDSSLVNKRIVQMLIKRISDQI